MEEEVQGQGGGDERGSNKGKRKTTDSHGRIRNGKGERKVEDGEQTGMKGNSKPAREVSKGGLKVQPGKGRARRQPYAKNWGKERKAQSSA